MVASQKSDDQEFFQFENDEEGFWEVLNKNEFIKVSDDAAVQYIAHSGKNTLWITFTALILNCFKKIQYHTLSVQLVQKQTVQILAMKICIIFQKFLTTLARFLSNT